MCVMAPCRSAGQLWTFSAHERTLVLRLPGLEVTFACSSSLSRWTCTNHSLTKAAISQSHSRVIRGKHGRPAVQSSGRWAAMTASLLLKAQSFHKLVRGVEQGHWASLLMAPPVIEQSSVICLLFLPLCNLTGIFFRAGMSLRHLQPGTT